MRWEWSWKAYEQRKLLISCKKQQVDMPITEALHSVLFEGIHPKEAVDLLMHRTKKHELDDYKSY